MCCAVFMSFLLDRPVRWAARTHVQHLMWPVSAPPRSAHLPCAPADAGLPNALALLTPIKEQFPEMGWADLIQVRECAAISHALCSCFAHAFCSCSTLGALAA